MRERIRMSDIIKEFLKRNRKKRLNIHCVGDAMIDEYYEVKVNRISPEFPMPIMTSVTDKPVSRPGGVANVAYQFKHFNVGPTLICFPDRKADKVFSEHGIPRWSGSYLPKLKANLPIKKRFLDGNIQVKRHDIEKPLCGMRPEDIEYFIDQLEYTIQHTKMKPDVVVMSDYSKGFFDDEYLHAPSLYPGAKTIIDPKGGKLSKWKECTIFKPNNEEAYRLTGRRTWKEQAKHLQNELQCEAVVITASGERVAGVWKEEFFCYQPKNSVSVKSVVGAGDCFGAFFAMAIGHDFAVPEAVEIAYTAGSVYVQRNMNRPVSPVELVEDGLVDPRDLAARDFKLVFTNGCFDVLHKGHMETLKFAKSKGDRLVVAVNTDESVRKLKGDGRPVVPLEHRMAVLASLKFVDYVVSFNEDTPLGLINTIKPDVLVKGAQYEKEEIVGAEVVLEVHRAPMIEGVSTSKLLDKNH
jgi:D-beta-D-heptose 7-phosphate kinase/D-beta-D-heptose 1-phosphate adenosyltransferase